MDIDDIKTFRKRLYGMRVRTDGCLISIERGFSGNISAVTTDGDFTEYIEFMLENIDEVIEALERKESGDATTQ